MGLLESMASPAIGGILGIGGQLINQAYYKKNIKTAAKTNYEYGEKAAENAHQRAQELMKLQQGMNLETYNRTQSIGAKMEQAKEAGVNYGMALGTGGMSGGAQGVATPQGAQGGGAGAQQGLIPGFGGELAQLGLMASEIQLNKAKAKEAEAKAGGEEIKNELLKKYGESETITRIANVAASTNNLDAQTQLTKLAQAQQRYQNGIIAATSKWQIKKAEWEFNKIKEETRAIQFQNDLNDEHREELSQNIINNAAILAVQKKLTELDFEIKDKVKESIAKDLVSSANLKEFEAKAKSADYYRFLSKHGGSVKNGITWETGERDILGDIYGAFTGLADDIGTIIPKK